MIKLSSVLTQTEELAVSQVDNTLNTSISEITSFNFAIGEQNIVVTKLQKFPTDEFISKEKLEKYSAEYPFIFGEDKPNEQQLANIKQQLAAGNAFASSLYDLDVKILNIEHELGAQRRMDDLRIRAEQANVQFAELQEKYSSVAELVDKQQETNTKLQQIKINYNQQILNQLKQKIIENLHSSINKPASNMFKQVVSNIKTNFESKPTWPLIIATVTTLILGITVSWIYKDIFTLLIAMVLFTVQAIGSVLFLGTDYQLSMSPESQANKLGEDWDVNKVVLSEDAQIKQILQQLGTKDITSAFTDSAYLLALQEDIKAVNGLIVEKLEGADINKLSEDLTNFKTQIDVDQQELKKLEIKTISPEQYLKKRRELDMMRMEKRRIANEDVAQLPTWIVLILNYLKEQGQNITAEQLATAESFFSDLISKFKLVSQQMLQAEFNLWPLVVSTKFATINTESLQELSKIRQVIIYKPQDEVS